MTSGKYSPKEIAGIILACMNETATTEQREQLQDWLSESDANVAFYGRLKSEHYRVEQIQEFAHYNSRQDWQKVRVRMRRKRKSIFIRFLPYVAVLALAVAVWSVIRSGQSPDYPVIAVREHIEPGYAKACLILPDGSRLELDSTHDTVVRNANFTSSGHTLAYSDSGLTISEKHILRIPRGGEYNLHLADGTKVWLNAETELHYPASFTGNTREVELTGEAYFEVARDTAHPFRVKTGGMVVSVLGTSFNVRAYAREMEQATLVSGKVEVACVNGKIGLRPGEQLSLLDGNTDVRAVNVNNYVGWKEQRFVFDDKMLVEVLNDLERWYNIQVFIADKAVRELRFTANLPKYENMDKVLQLIELAACVKCEVKGRTVVVQME